MEEPCWPVMEWNRYMTSTKTPIGKAIPGKDESNETKRLLTLVLILVSTALLVGGISITLLYRAALSEQKSTLMETVYSQAYLVENLLGYQRGHPTAGKDGSLSLFVERIQESL